MLLIVLVGGTVLVNGQSRTVHQHRTAHWIFGNGYHLTYDGASLELEPFIDNFYAREGASCISDLQGNLLFYSNSQQVWNKNHLLLLNSEGINSGILPTGTTITQGSLFLNLPGDTMDRFFVLFHIDDFDNKLYYSIIDRSLDGGLGGIIPEKKRISIMSTQVCEQLTAVKHANGRDWWILVRADYTNGNKIITLLFTSNGIVLINEWPASGFCGSGQMVFSNEGSLFASVMHRTDDCSTRPPTLILYTFDRCNGSVNIFKELVSRGCHISYYGVSFSPSSRILYVSTWRRYELFQVNWDSVSIWDSLIYRSVPIFGYHGGQIAQLSDGRLAVSNGDNMNSFILDNAYYLSIVKYPDSIGADCNYINDAIYLNNRLNITSSLPNFPNYDLGPLVGSPCDTLSPQDTTQVGLPVLPTSPAWTWSVTPTVSGSSFQVSTSQPAALTVHDLFGRERLRMDCAGQCGFDLKEQAAGWYVVSLTDRSGRRSEARKVLWQP